MPAYVSRSLSEFIEEMPDALVGELNHAYALDGFASQYTSQSRAWAESIPILQGHLRELLNQVPDSADWQVLLEFPLYRLKRRIDVVILTGRTVVVVELKVGETRFLNTDRRQVEEYALDLRDFHEGSAGVPILPCLWCTSAPSVGAHLQLTPGVSQVHDLGTEDIPIFLKRLFNCEPVSALRVAENWEYSAYRPIPDVIQVATTIFAGHGVREIARADASNLDESAHRIIEIIEETRNRSGRSLVILTGVPGSGKTLAGLQVVHGAIESGIEAKGDIVYLSGNTPLVTVLRESLALDEHRRQKEAGLKSKLDSVRN